MKHTWLMKQDNDPKKGWPSQTLDLNSIEMLCRDRTFVGKKPSMWLN